MKWLNKLPPALLAVIIGIAAVIAAIVIIFFLHKKRKRDTTTYPDAFHAEKNQDGNPVLHESYSGTQQAAFNSPSYSSGTLCQNAESAPIPLIDEGLERRISADKIRFSALTNKSVDRGNWLLVDLYAYTDAFRHLVDEAIANAEEPLQEKQSGYQNIREGQRISVYLRSPDLGFEDQQEMPWAGGFLDFSFAAEIPQDFQKNKILFVASVGIDGIPVTKLNFITSVRGENSRAEIERHDIRSAFVSYSSADREAVAMLIMGIKKGNPEIDLFFDVENISSGTYWESTLQKEILSRDILFLCWSRNASASEWVDKEWRYAYQQKGIEAIEPLPLEPPENCPPPAELQRKHFNNILLYVTGGKKSGHHTTTGQPHLQDLMNGTIYPLSSTPLIIGRGSDCGIVLDSDMTISRNHCSITCKNGSVVLQCTGTNGLLLFRNQDLQKIGSGETVPVNLSCFIRIGKSFLFQICTE